MQKRNNTALCECKRSSVQWASFIAPANSLPPLHTIEAKAPQKFHQPTVSLMKCFYRSYGLQHCLHLQRAPEEHNGAQAETSMGM